MFLYIYSFSAFLYISKIKKIFSKKTRKTSKKTEIGISKKPRNSQHTSYPFSSFTMMWAALSGAEV